MRLCARHLCSAIHEEVLLRPSVDLVSQIHTAVQNRFPKFHNRTVRSVRARNLKRTGGHVPQRSSQSVRDSRALHSCDSFTFIVELCPLRAPRQQSTGDHLGDLRAELICCFYSVTKSAANRAIWTESRPTHGRPRMIK